MKNSSWKHPFPTFADKMFDANKDGKLNTVETVFRDAHIEEMKRNAEKQESRPKSNSVISESLAVNTVCTQRHTTPKVVRLAFFTIAVIVLAVGIFMALSTEGTMFVKAIILFCTGAVAKGLLKFVGIHK